MTARYDNASFQFQYPENWTLMEEVDEEPQSVTLQSSSSGFWSVHCYDGDQDSQVLAQQALEAMRLEYDDIEVERIEQPMGDPASLGYDLEFYCLDLLVTAQIRVFTIPGKRLVVLYQAEDREFESIHRVFEAITTSMLAETGAKNPTSSAKRLSS